MKIMQWSCRGLSIRIPELLTFLKEKDIDFVCLNEVKGWHNESLAGGYFVVLETRASKLYASMISTKKRKTLNEVKREKKLIENELENFSKY